MTAAIRSAVAADAGAIAAIFAHYVTTTVISFAEVAPSEGTWAERIDRGMPFLVADLDGSVVGFAHTSPWRPQEGYRLTIEHGVYVSPDHTGRGLGTGLLRTLIAATAEAGYEQMIAVIAVAGDVGESSVRLHRRCGFRDVGVLESVGAKHGRRIDTRFMQLSLVARPRDQGR